MRHYGEDYYYQMEEYVGDEVTFTAKIDYVHHNTMIVGMSEEYYASVLYFHNDFVVALPDDHSFKAGDTVDVIGNISGFSLGRSGVYIVGEASISHN